MLQITDITEDIYRFDVPYKDIYAGVFILRTPAGSILFDTAATDEDADTYILPALAQLGITQLQYIFISHDHRDHSGGLSRVAQAFPRACIVARSQGLLARFANPGMAPEDGEYLLDRFRVVTIPGHTLDSMALLDEATGTLVSGDCLQVYGIYGSGAWGANIGFIAPHLEAIAKLRTLPIETVVAAHDYHPCGNLARGSAAVGRMLDDCEDALRRIREILLTNPDLADQAVADLCNDGSLPTVGARVVGAWRAALAGGTV